MNQTRFREANECLHDVVEDKPSPMQRVPFLCECADDDCMGRVEVTLTEWEDVASKPNQYVMEAGHQRSEDASRGRTTRIRDRAKAD
jgi:hypothetical protein